MSSAATAEPAREDGFLAGYIDKIPGGWYTVALVIVLLLLYFLSDGDAASEDVDARDPHVMKLVDQLNGS